MVDAQHAQPFAAVWGPGSTSSSDGQFFPAGGRGEAMSDYNARQGSEPGSVFYGFISDRFASYYSRVIAAAASEAARRELFAYLEGYYNRQRLHSALGYRTPEQAEQRAA